MPLKSLFSAALLIIPATFSAGLLALACHGGTTGGYAWVYFLTLSPLIALAAGLAYLALHRGKPGLPVFLFLLLVWPAGWSVGLFPFAYPGAAQAPVVKVRLPSNAPMVVMQGGPFVWRNHHAVFPNQRWAYDLGVPPVLSGGANNADYGCWGTEIVAPAAGKIVVAQDGYPDVLPGASNAQGVPAQGNHVVLQLADGSFLFLAHMQQNSVAVSAGDMVVQGDVLGRCGNSGASSEPHIHIHRQAEATGSPVPDIDTGLPLGFCGHDGPIIPEGLTAGLFAPPGPETATTFSHKGASC